MPLCGLPPTDGNQSTHMRAYRAPLGKGRRLAPLLGGFRAALTVACVASIALGCSGGLSPAGSSANVAAGNAGAQNPRLVATATIRELMDDVVDPSADGLWGSVGVVRTRSSTIHRAPRTAEEWASVRRQAITLAESANLLIIEPRRATPKGTLAGEGELSPEEIDERIAANRVAFEELAVNLRNVAQKALEAIDRRNSEELLEVGGEIDVACEACHTIFWYPDQAARKSSK